MMGFMSMNFTTQPPNSRKKSKLFGYTPRKPNISNMEPLKSPGFEKEKIKSSKASFSEFHVT